MSKHRKKKKSHRKEPSLQPAKEPQHYTEASGFFTLMIALSILLSLLSFAFGKGSYNKLGLVGYNVGWAFSSLFGISSYILSAFLGWIGWRLLFSHPIRAIEKKTVAIGALMFSLSILLSLIEDKFPHLANWVGNQLFTFQWQHKHHYHLGGAPFFYLYKDLPALNLLRIFNSLGVFILFFGLFASSILYLSKIQPANLARALQRAYRSLAERVKKQATEEDLETSLRYVKLRTPSHAAIEGTVRSAQKSREITELMQISPERLLTERPSISKKGSIDSHLPEVVRYEEKPSLVYPIAKPIDALSPRLRKERALEAQSVYNGNFEKYRLPSPALLTTPPKVDQSSLKVDLKKQAEVLEETLMSFGIEAKVGQINCGPTITSFEVHPAIGVKVQKIKTLENDIALNMEAQSIRIIAPIPGKAAVGIEVPNPHPQEVAFKDLLAAYRQSGQKMHIPLLLGKAVNGDFVMSDLAKMPHCIIAGATGSGKSVCINTIVMSILLNARPDEIKLIMVDPKKVELTPYSKLPHMLAPVITEPQGASSALNWLVKEMETRYEILKQTGFRNIEAFNNRTINEESEANLGIEIPKKMHYIVGIIDELADLMMVASSDIETPIARIAQMARAVGIHLILATQRPSREVITGLIKANFPTRIAFKVASRINSQIILDEIGAESLLGNGDMLFLPPGSSQLIRTQGAYIRDHDINQVVKHISDQAPPNYVIESFDRMNTLFDFSEDDPTCDPLYGEAKDIVMSTGNASTTFLQRKLKVGYARAASLIDELERRGIVGPLEGSKPRKVLAHAARAESEDPADEVDKDAIELLKLE